MSKHYQLKLWEENDDRDDDEPRSTTCNRCGATDLEWSHCGTAGWKLYDGKKLHLCRRNAADDFDVIEQ